MACTFVCWFSIWHLYQCNIVVIRSVNHMLKQSDRISIYYIYRMMLSLYVYFIYLSIYLYIYTLSRWFEAPTFCCWSFFGCLVIAFGGATPILADLKDSKRLRMVLWKISCTSSSSLLTSKWLRLNLCLCYKPNDTRTIDFCIFLETIWNSFVISTFYVIFQFHN